MHFWQLPPTWPRRIWFLFVLAGLCGLATNVAEGAPQPQEGVALALVYDTSGSMREAVTTAKGERAAKYIVGNRALEQIVRRIEQFATNQAVPRNVQAGLYIFQGTGSREAVPFGRFQASNFLNWLKTYRGPDSGTPLGTTLEAASRAVLASNLSQKHILVVTDGANTVGPDPASIVPQIQKAAAKKQSTLFVHFVAFDIDAKVFAPLKKMGVTVVGAADEAQLQQQLEFILEEKILLEKDDKK
jgi:Mg-chelatase subunit ChlD